MVKTGMKQEGLGQPLSNINPTCQTPAAQGLFPPTEGQGACNSEEAKNLSFKKLGLGDFLV